MKKMTKDINLKSAPIILVLALLLSISVVSAVTIKNVVTTPSEVAPGETAKISIEIENTLGNDIEDITVALDLNNDIPIAPYLGSSEENIDELSEGEEEKFTFDVIVLPGAPSGIYKIPVSINYKINGTPDEKNSTISLIVNSEPKIKLSIEGYLVKGSEGKVELRIVNNGLSDLKFLSVQAAQPSKATINSPLYEYLGNIDSDDFETIEYSIYAGEDSGTSVSIPFEISYKDATNQDFVQEETLNVKIYSAEEAVRLGLIPGKNYIVPVLSAILPLIYVLYRIRKRIKRKKALGA